MTDGGGYWCRACRTLSDDLDDRGRPRGWYKIELKTETRPADGDVRPGWYCSPACVCLAAMIALGVEPEAAVAWVRGDG